MNLGVLRIADNEELVAHVRRHLGDKPANELAEKLERFVSEARETLRESWFARMWDVSAFMKVLKQRFTQWFNGKHQRRGTLWEDRFRSVLVQGDSHALKTMAAYIDLNPVRAGICEDPKDYRWSGYGEAIGNTGSKEARAALQYLASISTEGGVKRARPSTHKAALEMWRRYLFGIPEAEERATPTLRKRVSRQKALEVLAEGGKLSEATYLRCRVRYFSDGAVIGGKAFVEELFQTNRARFSEARKTGARVLKGLEGGNLYNLRNLTKNPLS